MKYNAFNLNISTDTDIPFLRHGHIQDAEAEIYVFRHSIPYYEQVSCGRNDTWAINAYPEYVITYNRLPESPVIGELTIYTDDIHIFLSCLPGRLLACFCLSETIFFYTLPQLCGTALPICFPVIPMPANRQWHLLRINIWTLPFYAMI